MRIPALVLISVTATVFLTSASPQEKGDSPPEVIEASTKKVRELQKERVATLTLMVETSSRLAKAARIELSELLDDRMTLLRAEVDLAQKESDRIALYEKALESLKEYHALAKARLESARGTELHVFKTKSRMLEVEILLEQAKIKVAAETR